MPSRHSLTQRLGLLACAIAAVLAACGSPSSGDDETADEKGGSRPQSAGCENPDPEFAEVGEDGTMTSGTDERQFSLAVPEEADLQPYPLIVSLHGARATRAQHEEASHLAERGTRDGFVVVTPLARGDRPIWSIGDYSVDSTFIEELVKEVKDRVCIDPQRAYLAGFSIGGMMSMDLACRYPGEYAAIAVVAGVSDVKACAQHLGPPVPLLAFHGTADDTVEFDGGFSPEVNAVTGVPDGRSREEIVASWAQANRCGPEPTVSAVEPNLERIVHDCPTDAAVELYVIAGGPHEWPGGGADDDPEASESESTSAIEATELILEFFEQHPSGG